MLIAERLSLNLMQRMSGIATATRRMVDAVGNNRARILGTYHTLCHQYCYVTHMTITCMMLHA